MVLVRAFGVQDLHEAAEAETVAILYHPFTLSSLAGTLPLSSLSGFKRDEAFILSAAASVSAQKSTKTLLLRHVQRYYQDDKDGVITESAKSLASFIQEQAAENDCKGVVVLMALLHIRVFLEKTVCRFMPDGGDQNSAWTTGYGEADFQACASLVEEDLEAKLSEQRIFDEKWNNELLHVFIATLAHQLRVFTSAYAGRKDLVTCSSNPWHPANLLFTTDYDVTCTVKDTSEILVSVAQKNSSGGISLEDSYWSLMKVHDNRIKDCLSLWEYGSVSARLTPLSEKRSCLSHLIPGMDSRLETHVSGGLKEQLVHPERSCEYENSNLRGILRQLGDLERKINKDVMAAGVLKGVTRKEIREEVKRIPLLPRCSEFLQTLSAMNTPIHSISASWSRDLIIGGLPSLSDGHLFVHSNDLEYDSSGVSTGSFRGVVEDSFDKEAILHALRRMYNVYPEEGKRRAVFLGDSTNDLLALLDADLGIVMGQNPAFREMLVRYNLQLLPLAVAAAHIRASVESGDRAKSYRHSGILFEASGWAEVEACLLVG